jgi:murein L,D-transpeptidase YcbB/YkuD
LNIERRRWLPDEFVSRYILVNIPDFKLIYVENQKTVLTMKVIVGRESRPTPTLASEIISVELNPHWQIPVAIARKDIVPKIIENPDYLSDSNIRIFSGWGKDASEIDQKYINWFQIKPEIFSFRLRQEPGPSNSLGQIKFIFPNSYQVYLHDTPARGLFQKSNRSSSSGCIRLEKPFELAKYLFSSGQGWTGAKILAAIKSGQTQILRLPKSVPIYIGYWTAWVDDANILNFRDDIYERDKYLPDVIEARRYLTVD